IPPTAGFPFPQKKHHLIKTLNHSLSFPHRFFIISSAIIIKVSIDVQMEEQSVRETDPLIEAKPISYSGVEVSMFDDVVDGSEKRVGDGGGCGGEGEGSDVEAGSAPCCRICLECDGEEVFLDHVGVNTGEDSMVGDITCLEGFAFSHCTTCKAQFHLCAELFEDKSWCKVKFRLFVARDVVLVFLAVQLAMAGIGAFVFLMDKDGAFRNSFSDGWDQMLSNSTIELANLFLPVIIMPCSLKHCCYGWGILDCFPASAEACFALVLVFMVIFAILGIAYGFLAVPWLSRGYCRDTITSSRRGSCQRSTLLRTSMAVILLQNWTRNMKKD
ncbi:hypothetical protein AKJ16_DCAP11586, partial [Drosera capensis]